MPISVEEAKRIHRRMVRKIGDKTFDREKHGELWDAAQSVLDREIYAPRREALAEGKRATTLERR